MDPFTDWDIPNNDVIRNEELDQYLENYDEEIDDLFNQTLVGLQDLDVPTGFVNDLQTQNPTTFHSSQFSHHTSNSMNFYNHSAKHSRKVSGTAIFGFDNHTRELSIDLSSGSKSNSNSNVTSNPVSNPSGKSISPIQLLKTAHAPTIQSSPLQKSIGFKPETIHEDHNEPKVPQTVGGKPKKRNDYIVTNTNPRSYKFPPSPTGSDAGGPLPARGSPVKQSIVNSYSAKYLQELGRLNSGSKSPVYADDIGPLLNEEVEEDQEIQSTNPFTNNQLKYVPIPVQEPSASTQQKQQQQDQDKKQSFSSTYLPPPSPPALSHGSPEQSSPEPRSYEESSPEHLESSPVHSIQINQRNQNENNLFYNPQFFSDDNNFFEQAPDFSSPVPNSLNSSPIKGNYYSSPLRQVPINDYDETVDADNTLPQMTPLKPTYPITPSRNKVVLEWSPIVSPDAKSSKDVKLAIRQGSSKKRIKKTSLLPPGELDKYWEGPDENKYFVCTYMDCGKKFTRRYNVRSHIQTHLSDRPFSCAYCPKKFVRQHDLNRHVKGHLEARPSKCPCGKEFARIDAMKNHRSRNICSGGVATEGAANEGVATEGAANEGMGSEEGAKDEKHDFQPDYQSDIPDSDNYYANNTLTDNLLEEINQISSF